jgi:hypothetical protein
MSTITSSGMIDSLRCLILPIRLNAFQGGFNIQEAGFVHINSLTYTECYQYCAFCALMHSETQSLLLIR